MTPTSDRGQAKAHYEKALAFYAKERYADAIDEYHLALQDWPRYREAHFGLGVSFIKTEFYRGAILALNRAIGLQPEYPIAYLNLGVAQARLAQHKEAKSSFEKTLSQSANLVEVWFPLAKTYEALGETQAAVAAYQKAVEFTPYEANVALASAYAAIGDTIRLISHLNLAAEADSTRHEPWFELGAVLEASGQYEKAAEAYQEVLARNTSIPGLAMKLAGVFAISGNQEAAARLYEQVIAEAPEDATALFNLGVTYDALGRLDEAIEVYRRAVSHRKAFADAHMNLAIDLMEKRAFQMALTAYESFLKYEPEGRQKTEVEKIVDQLKAALGK